MSLHEIDLATKISDYLLCVKGDTIEAFGPPEDILADGAIDKLYDIQHGSYNLLFGSVELAKPQGEPQVFVVGGGGAGIVCYRALQKRQIPFAAGILFTNDVDYPVAQELSDYVVTSPAFEPMTEAHYQQAAQILLRCACVIDAGTSVGTLNSMNGRLLDLAREKGIPLYSGWQAMENKKDSREKQTA